jgi:hypothetical protein
LKHEKKECRRAKTELEQLKRRQAHAVDTPTSAEHFTQRVLELATRQQEVERRQREQRASLASSGEHRSSEYSNLSSNNRVSGDGSGHFRDTEVAGTKVAGTEVAGTKVAGTEVAGAEVAGTEAAGTEVAGTEVAGTEMINIRRSSSSLSVTREPSPHTPMQHPHPAGSVPTALFGNSQEHHRHRRTVGPVIHDDGKQVREENREWKTCDSSVGGSENDV